MLARVGLAAALLAGVALVDFLRHRTRSKAKEYGFILLAGVLGALFALLNDLLVSLPLSPDYFIIGKGVDRGPGFRWRVAELALAAGFGPGALVGGVYVLANRAALPYSRLAREFWKPPVTATVTALIFALALSNLDPAGFRLAISLESGDVEARRFLLVWWIHLGLYAGCFVGIAWGAVTIRRATSASSPRPAPSASPASLRP